MDAQHTCYLSANRGVAGHTSERHEPHAILMTGSGRARQLQGQARLATAARPDECQEPGAVQELTGAGDFLAPPDEASRRQWEVGNVRRVERRVLPADGVLEGDQVVAGIDTELVFQHPRDTQIRGEGLGVTAAPMQCQHELAGESLVGRMGRRQPTQLSKHPFLMPECQFRIDASLDCLKSRPLQLERGSAGPGTGWDTREGRPPPERQRLGQRCRSLEGFPAQALAGLPDLLGETPDVGLLRVRVQSVTARMRFETGTDDTS